ncbi:putative phosphoric monoester hydrolase [Helianthus annuus]|uniref:Purple acid phosphatase n=1 Tax=Helianthus annuus TaxID=4232 RepID=A0A251TN46_HELAN|nr:purple acid phosphatase 2 [Helianthus annuus]KAF5787425.1 putative phosphoric monoester hydrolase [Helianthus annuus]
MGLLYICFSVIVLTLYHGVVVNSGITSSFVRQEAKSVDMPFTSDVFIHPPGYNAPQQVHITQGDHVGRAVIVSWVTQDEPGSSTVVYWADKSHQKQNATGRITTYKYYNYTSGFIHHSIIKNLEFDTKYHYEVGTGHTTRRFWFMTPPAVGPDVPYTFGLMGDLGQTYDSNLTLTHYEMNPVKGQAVLFVGDLSYADHYTFHDNSRWDSWGRFAERSTAYQPWIWTAGNHELDYEPSIGETKPFKPFLHRYRTPFRSSGSTEPLWYSIKRASAYVIVLSSYSAYGMYTPQYQWLLEEFPKVNRSETPWLIVLMHSPWYNSNSYHFMEGETMRVMFEPWFVQYKVDLVFAGHVHAYERSERISNIAYNIVNGECTPVVDQSAPVYITIGDGGNIEGLANNMTEPQPKYSAYREASFGHATLEIKNRTHAYYNWHRNSDGYAVRADSVMFFNRYWHPKDDSTSKT